VLEKAADGRAGVGTEELLRIGADEYAGIHNQARSMRKAVLVVHGVGDHRISIRKRRAVSITVRKTGISGIKIAK
jgi:hypothetical protein